MTTRTRSQIYVSIAAMILTAALAVPAAAQQVPFKGAFEGHDTVSPGPSPTTALLVTTATGTGTHLGHFSFTQQVTVVGLTATGSGQWVAANGDSIYTTVVSSAELTDIPNQLKVTEIHTITGGTGRFTTAEGSFTVDRIHIMVPLPGLPPTFVTYGSFHGTITSPGKGH